MFVLKISALLQLRLSPPKASGSRRVANAAQRQMLRHVHVGNERAVSLGGPIPPPLLSRTRLHDTRATLPARVSEWLQRVRWRGLAGIGIRRRLKLRRERAVAISSLKNVVNSVSLEKEDINARNIGHPFWCLGKQCERSRSAGGASIMKVATRS